MARGKDLTERERLQYEEKLRVAIEAAGLLFSAEKVAESWGKRDLAQANRRLAVAIYEEIVDIQQTLLIGRQ